MVAEVKEENIDDVANRKLAKFFWLKNIFKTTSHKRLDAAIGPFELELRTLIDNKQNDSPWAQRSIQTLQRAKKALQLCEIELGWRYFFQAQLFSRHLLDSKSLRNRAQAILNEAEEKLSSWRKKTVQDYLGKNGVLNEEMSNVNDVCDAERILQEHHTNTYIKLSRALFQLEILVPLASLLIVLSILILMNFSGQIAINNPFLLLSIFILGAIGGTVSGIITNVRSSIKGRIPDQLLNSWLTLSRPVFGAMAALAITAFLLSGLIQLGDISFNLILALSFAAGFSELILLKTMEKIS